MTTKIWKYRDKICHSMISHYHSFPFLPTISRHIDKQVSPYCMNLYSKSEKPVQTTQHLLIVLWISKVEWWLHGTRWYRAAFLFTCSLTKINLVSTFASFKKFEKIRSLREKAKLLSFISSSMETCLTKLFESNQGSTALDKEWSQLWDDESWQIK